MGCIAPTNAIQKSHLRVIEKEILKPFLKGMQKENRPFSGILYLGGMVTKQGIKIVEFNARWGEPEAEVVLSGLQTDYLSLVHSVLNQKLNKTNIVFDNKIRISIAGCAHGYPTDYSAAKGKKIYGLQEVKKIPGITVYGSGMKKVGENYVVTGGRLFHLVAEGATIREARKRAYAAMSLIYIEGDNLQYRTDIGWRELERILK
jgi:phosphoribosylamine--glycine ligase